MHLQLKSLLSISEDKGAIAGKPMASIETTPIEEIVNYYALYLKKECDEPRGSAEGKARGFAERPGVRRFECNS